jgi:hypothetical protein
LNSSAVCTAADAPSLMMAISCASPTPRDSSSSMPLRYTPTDVSSSTTRPPAAEDSAGAAAEAAAAALLFSKSPAARLSDGLSASACERGRSSSTITPPHAPFSTV